ncbi:hypothetical protein PE36_10618 [Moritella sp. PE36]|uniref:metal-dependent hydrolase n=1 Tax=Moritella sp. PE36 TaxID=58051 RepID=UPI0001569C69|nr:metal-dependent hydrolase [Moritella sp. PE36]EDM66040.1 hypothetical protein PE36_10618 [Moritella sp. PE36]
MDSVTQIVLGGAIGAAIAHKQLGRTALIIGGVLGTLPDLDVFLPAADAVASFTEHRSFSHSLLVLFPFAFICFTALKLKFKTDVISNQRLFWLCCLTLVTHPLLDAFTSYGTQLFWPLAGHPVSIASIFVIDPLYTIPLLVGCVYLWRSKESKDKRKARRVNHIGLMLSSGYLLLSVLLQTQMQNKVEIALQSSGIPTDKIFISPLYPSLNWWGAIVLDNGVYYDVKLNVLTNSLDISAKQDLGYGVIDVSTPALTSLDWFTNGFIRLEDVEGRLVATDLRMKTGHIGYAFKFALAEKDTDGWKAISPLRL